MAYPSQRPKKAAHYRVRLTLSRQNWVVLLGLGLLALGGLAFLYGAGFMTPDVNHPPPAPRTVLVRVTYEEMFVDIAARHDLDWHLLVGQAYYESGFDPQAVGAYQDTGLMQIIPTTWEAWAPQAGVTDPTDPYSNVLVAALYLAFLRDHFAELGYSDERWMLAAYNWGPHNLQQHLENGGTWAGIPEIRRRYALNVLRAKRELPPAWAVMREEPVIVSRLLE